MLKALCPAPFSQCPSSLLGSHGASFPVLCLEQSQGSSLCTLPCTPSSRSSWGPAVTVPRLGELPPPCTVATIAALRLLLGLSGPEEAPCSVPQRSLSCPPPGGAFREDCLLLPFAFPGRESEPADVEGRQRKPGTLHPTGILYVLLLLLQFTFESPPMVAFRILLRVVPCDRWGRWA